MSYLFFLNGRINVLENFVRMIFMCCINNLFLVLFKIIIIFEKI